jgi:vanillate O-demethylase ferredoxin subunit
MTLQVRIKSLTWEAPNIVSYDLRRVGEGELPPFTAGAHIDLKLGNGLMRSYSLLNPQAERHRYVIAVQKDRASRGGSQWIHEHLRPGDVIGIDGPRNNFALCETAERSLFVAGGIGITPILSMVERLETLGRCWQLVYCARRRSGTAFAEILETKPEVRFNFDEEPGGKVLDIAGVVRNTPPGTHLYCCGPLPMLSAFEDATRDIDRDRVHLEYFTAKEPPSKSGGFTVVLARSRREVLVPEGMTILEALRNEGFDLPYSCLEGVCGSCETAVLEGVPDHRDLVLTESERARNNTMMICCSGSKTEKLVLDI